MPNDWTFLRGGECLLFARCYSVFSLVDAWWNRDLFPSWQMMPGKQGCKHSGGHDQNPKLS